VATVPRKRKNARPSPRRRPQSRARPVADARILAETVADAVITIDADSRILYVNPSASRMFGYSAPEMLGQSLTLLMPEALRERHQSSLARYVATRERHLDWQAVELVARHRSGREIPVEISFGESGDEAHPTFTGVVRDITERKRAEAVRSALLLVAEKAQAATDMPELYAGISEALRRVMGAKSFRVVVRDSSSEALHVGYLAGEATIPPRSPQLGEEWTAEVVRTGDPFLAPESPGVPAGSWLGVPLKAGEKVLGALVVRARPETPAYGPRETEILTFVARQVVAALERSRAQDELRRTVAVLRSTLDSTADGILVVDHEGRVVSFNERFAALWRIPARLLTMRDDAALLAHALDQLKDPGQFLSKVQELYSQPEAEAFDVLEFKDGRIFERYSMPHRLGREAKGRVWSFRDVTRSRDLERQLRQSDKLDAVRRLAGGVAQDFNNLLTVVESRTALARTGLGPEAPLRRHLDEILAAAVRASALTQQLLAFSRGQDLAPPAERRPVATVTGPPPRGSETVLLVEHHEAVRLVEREILQTQGYDVLEAGQGAEALRIQQQCGRPVHLMVTDVVMPDMSGPELSRRLARSSPGTRVLFVSGQADADDAPDGILARDAAFLLKPFSPDAFARKVREALAGPAPSY
jgi:PAS domain S-box-containing protein